jgi:hypothetical protein
MEHVKNINEIVVNGRYCYQTKNTCVEFTVTHEPVLERPTNKLLQHLTLQAIDDQGAPIVLIVLVCITNDVNSGVEKFVIVKCVDNGRESFEILCTPHVVAPTFK